MKEKKLFNYIDDVELSATQKQRLIEGVPPVEVRAKPRMSLIHKNGLMLAAGMAAVALFFGAVWVFGDFARSDESGVAGVGGEGEPLLTEEGLLPCDAPETTTAANLDSNEPRHDWRNHDCADDDNCFLRICSECGGSGSGRCAVRGESWRGDCGCFYGGVWNVEGLFYECEFCNSSDNDCVSQYCDLCDTVLAIHCRITLRVMARPLNCCRVCDGSCCSKTVCDTCGEVWGGGCRVQGVAWRSACACRREGFAPDDYECETCGLFGVGCRIEFCVCGIPSTIICRTTGSGRHQDHHPCVPETDICVCEIVGCPHPSHGWGENPPESYDPCACEAEGCPNPTHSHNWPETPETCVCEERWGIQLCCCGGLAGGRCDCDNPCPRNFCSSPNCV